MICLCWAWWSPLAGRRWLSQKIKKIGMIATLASARSGAYERTLKGLDADVQVVSQPCPLFVPLVENGRFRQGDVVIETVAREYLTPLIEAGVDTLILGCTHYPLLKDIIGEICGPGVTLIDSGAPRPGHCGSSLQQRASLRTGSRAKPALCQRSAGGL